MSWFAGIGAVSVGAVTLAFAGAALGQMTDVTAARGFVANSTGFGMCSGASAADFDNDGDIDVFLPNGDGVADQLYVNQGDGTFVEAAEAYGLALTDQHRAAVWFDFNNDHRLDIAIAGDCFDDLSCDRRTDAVVLFRQQADGTFLDVTLNSGLDDALMLTFESHVGGIAAGDLDNDGHLDLMVNIWQGFSTIYYNNGNETFTSRRDRLELLGTTYGLPWQPMFHDFNGDGWLDIYQNMDFWENRLWLSQGDGSFVNDAAAAGLDNDMNDMGLTLGDFDNDGDFDLYICNIFEYLGDTDRRNTLFRNDSNDGSMVFTEVALESGVADCDWGWGTTFLDFNNDSFLDIVATNGFFHTEWRSTPARLFEGQGPIGVPGSSGEWQFVDVAPAQGMTEEYFGSGLLSFDADGDGDLELMQISMEGDPMIFLDNGLHDAGTEGTATSTNYVVIRPRMPGANHRAIGAIVRITINGVTQSRLISAGCSMLCQEPAEAHFGLGDAELIDEVRIEWPGGTTAPADTVLTDVSVNRVVRVIAGCVGDLTGDNAVTTADLTEFLGYFGQSVPADSLGDLTGDGSVTTSDLTMFLMLFGTGC